MGHTKKIADFIVNTAHGSIPSQAFEVAKTAFLDCLGVMLAGSRDDSAKICAALVREEGARAESTVIGQGFKTSAAMAALANGAASHALDYDHSFSLQGQPTAALIPALISQGEALGTSGRNLLTAYVVAFEVATKLARAIPDHSALGGWHSTGTIGTIGAAAGCAKLLGLGVQAAEMALGAAASMASGIVANFGTMAKPLHAGLAARNGVSAAGLARRGFTSNPGIIERPKGFFDTFSRALAVDEAQIASLGSRFELVESGIRIKAYPCGGLTHSAIDALLKLRRDYEMGIEAIEKIHVAVTRHTYEAIVYRIPETGLQGKFSMPYILARVLKQGRLGLDDFTDGAVKEPSVRALAEKVHMEHDPALEEDTEGRRPSIVTVRLRDGRTLSRRVDYPRGGREAPLSKAELREKFFACARTAIAEEKQIERIIESLRRLENVDQLGPICGLLSGATSS